jgi:hypothetical protein
MDIRVFRLSRMSRLRFSGNICPSRLMLQDVEQQFMSKADFMKVKAILRFQPEVTTRVQDEFGFDQVILNPNGTLSLATHFSSTEPQIRLFVTQSPALILHMVFSRKKPPMECGLKISLKVLFGLLIR